MMALALLFGVLTPAQDAADQANEAYVACLFAVARAANAERLSSDRFESRLAASCRIEEATARQRFIRVAGERGGPGIEEIDRLLRQARIDVAATYRQNR